MNHTDFSTAYAFVTSLGGGSDHCLCSEICRLKSRGSDLLLVSLCSVTILYLFEIFFSYPTFVTRSSQLIPVMWQCYFALSFHNLRGTLKGKTLKMNISIVSWQILLFILKTYVILSYILKTNFIYIFFHKCDLDCVVFGKLFH